MAAYINIIFANDGIDRTRVKEILSIDDKIRRYKADPKKNYGSVIVHKALNDLYGARVILDYDFDFDELTEDIKNVFATTYTINACNDRGYKAVHVYVKCKKGHFRWELQIWNRNDEKTNIKLHEEYKREYIKELEEIGGENNVHS